MRPELVDAGGRFLRKTHPWRKLMHGRPRLKSHVQLLRRGPGSLQLGVCPDTGVVLDGLSDAEIAMVKGLDGSVDTHTLYAGAAAGGPGIQGVGVHAAVETLHHGDLRVAEPVQDDSGVGAHAELE